ncbi:fatty acid desaturase [Rhodopila sp.]|uniref:fatty acid desaturase n=1 Tax=Rhodopila sp. TaxID=2480087 RepID=UPI003D0D87E3
MSGLSDRVLTNQELRALQGRSNLRGGVRLAIHISLLAAAGWIVTIASGWLVLPAVFALGCVQVALFAPAHETMHQTAFASRRTNAIVGWLTSCPSLLNWHFYTAYHLAHHRHTQVPGLDPELAAVSPDSIGGYVSRILGVPFWTLRLRVLVDCWRGDLGAYPYVSAAAARKIIRSGRAMTLLMVGASLGAMLVFGWLTPFLYWIGPQLLGQPPLRAYLLAEHTGCTQDRNGLTNTRTTLTSAPVRLLMWDMPYHAEHHLFPSIPFHRLADAHGLIRGKLGHVQPGYLRWNFAFARSLVRR